MMVSFPKKRSYNPGGLVGFDFVHYGDIANFPSIVTGEIGSVPQLHPGKQWATGYATPGTLQFTEESELSAQGRAYRQSVTGFIPNDYGELIALMELMDNQHFCLLIMDANQRRRLVGGYGYPLLFSASGDTGSNRSDSKGFNFQFVSRTPFRAPVIAL